MARILRDYPSVTLKLEDLDDQIDFVQIFGRSAPIHIEVGTGKATFLLNEAKAQPNINFVGIEWAKKYFRYAVDRIGRWGLNNVRIVRTDAVLFLANAVPDGSVDCFHIYFPDPWPKKRHHKRRFFCPDNLKHLIRCLKTGGQVRISTDHSEYFEQIQKLIADRGSRHFGFAQGRLEEIEFLPAVSVEHGELTGTNYERKYIKDKRQIYTLAVQKK